MSKISVLRVLPNEVEMMVGNVFFKFYIDENGKLRFIKFKEAQIYDPAEHWVPAALFKQACRQAAAILRSRQKKSA